MGLSTRKAEGETIPGAWLVNFYTGRFLEQIQKGRLFWRKIMIWVAFLGTETAFCLGTSSEEETSGM